MASTPADFRLLDVSVLSPLTELAGERAHAELQAEVLALFSELRNGLLRYCMSFGLALNDSEDVLQEVFLALFRHLQRGRSRENLRGWLFRATHNLALKQRSFLHAERRLHSDDDQDGLFAEFSDATPGPEEDLLFRERKRRLWAVVRALSQNDQHCLRLRAEGLRYREIASVVGISLGSVAASLARSFARLERVDRG